MEDIKTHEAADLVMGWLLILFGALVINASLRMKIYKTFLDAPGFFPTILGVIFMLLGTMMTITALRRGGLARLKSAFSKNAVVAVVQDKRTKKAAVLIALMMVYIFGLIGRVHFTIATVLYLFGTFFYLKSTTWIKMLLISILTSLAISTVFTYALRIPLP